jgi:hypothetical protein
MTFFCTGAVGAVAFSAAGFTMEMGVAEIAVAPAWLVVAGVVFTGAAEVVVFWLGLAMFFLSWNGSMP